MRNVFFQRRHLLLKDKLRSQVVQWLKRIRARRAPDSVLFWVPPTQIWSRPLSRSYNSHFFLFLLYPCFPLKYLFLNSRVECSVNHPPSSALLTPSSYCCCFCSVAKSYLIFATPWTAARQAPLSLEFAETHVHWVCDAIQPSHPLSSPSLPAFSISQHQGLFQWVCCLHQVAEVLELPMNSHSWFPLGLTVWSPCSPRDSQESSPAPQFESISSSPFSLLYGPTLTSI